uniref:Putative serum amyloid a n=1 Tax=Amblyomma cajennense TaxID=34607 RepID=A0A023FQ83_AMBCJ
MLRRFPVRPSLLLLPLLLVLLLCTVCGEGRSGPAQWTVFTVCVHSRARHLLKTPSGACAAAYMFQQFRAMNNANCRKCDKYFHCRANYLAVRSCRGRFNRRVAEIISNCREVSQPGNPKDRREDEEANRFGRRGGNCGAKYLRSYGCAYNPKNGKCKW